MKPTFNKITIVSLLFLVAGLTLIYACARYGTCGSELSGIGLSLITAGIVAVTIDKVSLAELSAEVTSIVQDGLCALRMKNFGITNIVTNTPYQEIYAAMDLSKDFILVQTWSPDMKNILKHCESLLARGGRVTIFLLNPDSPAATQRSLDLQEKPDHVPAKIRSDADQIFSMYRRLIKHGLKESSLKARLRFFYYKTLPSFAIYKTDKNAWVAFYWYGIQSDSGMNIVIDFHSDNPAKARYEDHLSFLEQTSDPQRLD